MSFTFTKLFSSITESTVWMETSNVRIVWITMLAMADRKGRVWASIPGLANRARVPIDDCRKAIDTFLSPDADSRTHDFDGRRIEPIDGGWHLLNHEKYRALRDEEATKESKRNYINERRRKERQARKSVENNSTVERGRTKSTQAEADTESDPLHPNPSPAAPAETAPEPKPPSVSAEAIYDAYPRKVGRKAALTAISRAVHASPKSAQQILEATRAYAAATSKWPPDDHHFIPHPTTWFNQGRFDDDPTEWERQPHGTTSNQRPNDRRIGATQGWLDDLKKAGIG